MSINMKIIRNIFVIILLFTFADALGHKYLEVNYNMYEVPQDYYLNKVLYGVPLLLLAFFIYENFLEKSFKGEYTRTFILTSITVLGLQYRYYYTYSSRFNVTVLILHYVILAAIIYFAEEKKYL